MHEELISSINYLMNCFPFLKRISDKAYSYIKNGAYLVFIYSEVEQYFFKCMKKYLNILMRLEH